jgi:hypothetical protein
MSRVRVSAPERAKIRPAFMVQRLEGSRKREVIFLDPKTHKRDTKVVDEPAGYLVTMMNGNSIRVRNDEELARLGFDQTIDLINEDGESVGEIDNAIMRQALGNELTAE